MSYEEKKLYLINDQLYDEALIEKLISEGKDKLLSFCHAADTAGVYYIGDGKYMSYMTGERATFDEQTTHKSFKEAIAGARQKYEDFKYLMQYIERSINRRKRK